MKNLERLFKALSDRNRIRILKMLEVRPLCNCEVQEVLGLAPSTVSKHLTLLRNADLIQDRREGKWVIYNLTQVTDSPYSPALLKLVQGWLKTDEAIVSDGAQVRQMQGKFSCTVEA